MMKEKIKFATIPSGLFMAMLIALVLGLFSYVFYFIFHVFSVTTHNVLSILLDSFIKIKWFDIVTNFCLLAVFYKGFYKESKLVKNAVVALTGVFLLQLLVNISLFSIEFTPSTLENFEHFTIFFEVAKMILVAVGAVGIMQTLDGWKKFVGVFMLVYMILNFLLDPPYGDLMNEFSSNLLFICKYIFLWFMKVLLFIYIVLVFKKAPFDQKVFDADETSDFENMSQWILAGWSHKGIIFFWVSAFIQFFSIFVLLKWVDEDHIYRFHIPYLLCLLMLLSSWIWYIVWAQSVEFLAPFFSNFDKGLMKKVLLGLIIVWLLFVCVGLYDLFTLKTKMVMVMEMESEDYQSLMSTDMLTTFGQWAISPIIFTLMLSFISGAIITYKTNVTARNAYKYVGAFFVMGFYLVLAVHCCKLKSQLDDYEVLGEGDGYSLVEKLGKLEFAEKGLFYYRSILQVPRDISLPKNQVVLKKNKKNNTIVICSEATAKIGKHDLNYSTFNIVSLTPDSLKDYHTDEQIEKSKFECLHQAKDIYLDGEVHYGSNYHVQYSSKLSMLNINGTIFQLSAEENKEFKEHLNNLKPYSGFNYDDDYYVRDGTLKFYLNGCKYYKYSPMYVTNDHDVEWLYNKIFTENTALFAEKYK